MGIAIGMVGCGSFAQSFIPLFKAHPLVEGIVLCDLDPRKLRENSRKHGIAETSPSLSDLCETDVDAVAIITQPWLHGPQALEALSSGKHVYCAVPTGQSVDEIRSLVRTVAGTNLVYMLGETSYYYPGVIYCRDRFHRGDFGEVVYGEGEYYHDWDHGLYDVAKWRGGARWMERAAMPPMYYPTHSTSQIISVTGAHAVTVSCFGFVDRGEDGIYRAEANVYGNAFSNESALFAMSDGSVCRINEFRRVGHVGAVRMCLFGTHGSFEQNTAGSSWVEKDSSTPLDEVLACRGQPSGRGDGTHLGVSQLHPVERLPREFIGLPNGHCGSHQFLVDDFVKACANDETPPNNVWDAARYALPGIVAHDSAMKGGRMLKIPDFGDPPAGA
jgi:predicted dehydrogenase